MPRPLVCSAVGNRILRLSGFFFAAAGAGLLTYLVVTTWGYASRVEHFLGLVLLATSGAGAYVIIACGATRSLESVTPGEVRAMSMRR